MSWHQRHLSAAGAGAVQCHSQRRNPPDSHMHLLTHRAAGSHSTASQALKQGGEKPEERLGSDLGQGETLSSRGPRLSPGASFKAHTGELCRAAQLPAEAPWPAELSETHRGERGESRSAGGGDCWARCPAGTRKVFFPSPCDCLGVPGALPSSGQAPGAAQAGRCLRAEILSPLALYPGHFTSPVTQHQVEHERS